VYTGGVLAISSPVETRFGSYHFVLRDIVHSKEALQRLTTTDDWEQAVRGNNSLAAAHTALHALGDDNLWVVCTKLQLLFDPIMNAIHQFEADQPMLSFVHESLNQIEAHVINFEMKYPECAAGLIPADRRTANAAPTPCSLTSTVMACCDFVRRPAMLAAHVLDPINWRLNSTSGAYLTPLLDLDDDQSDALNSFASAFGVADAAEQELNALLCNGINKRFSKAVELCAKPSSEVAGTSRARGTIPDASCRLNVWLNLIAGTYPVLTKVARCVLTMPATACATERNWTLWGQVFIKTRSCLGLQRAQDMIYVKQNDQLGRDAASGCPSELAIELDAMSFSFTADEEAALIDDDVELCG
jgi:hypothetical protein